MRDGHYTFRRRKLGQGSGTTKTAASPLPRPLLEVIPGQNSLWAQLSTRWALTEALFQLCSGTISWLHTVMRLCDGLVADSTSSWPSFQGDDVVGRGLLCLAYIPKGQGREPSAPKAERACEPS